jgi:hypothetical protein
LRSTSFSAAESRPQIRPILQPGQQFADAHGPYFRGGKGERAPVGIEVGFRPDQDPGSLGGRRVGGIQHRARADHPDRDRRDRVTQGQERRAAAPGQLGDLAFDPDPAETADPLAGQPQDGADRDRCFG